MQFGNGTLRLTTRQAYQLHGVLKHDLKTVFSTVVKNMGSTLGACGDVNRNVMGACAPYVNRTDYMHAQKVANDIADLLAPQSGAYYDVWLDGEKFVSVYKEVRKTFLPDKIKRGEGGLPPGLPCRCFVVTLGCHRVSLHLQRLGGQLCGLLWLLC